MEIVVGIWTRPQQEKENAELVVLLCAGCVWARRILFGGEERVSKSLGVALGELKSVDRDGDGMPQSMIPTTNAFVVGRKAVDAGSSMVAAAS